MDRLTISMNAAPLRPPLSGIGRYTDQLARAFSVEPQVELNLNYYGFSRSYADMQRLVSGPIGAAARVAAKIPLLPRMAYRLLQRRSGNSQETGAKTIYFEPNFIDIGLPGKLCATIHDLSVLRFSDFHPAERVAIFQKELAKTINRAELLITDSESVRQEVLGTFHVEPSRVVAIPLAPYTEAIPSGPLPKPQRFGLDGRTYILTVGTLEPRKNLERVAEAWRSIRRDLPAGSKWVHAGPKGWGKTELHGLSKDLVQTGYVSDSELASLYRNATCVVCPSLYEGFGLPLLEAQASGTPVICSDIPAHREIAAEHTLMFNPFEAEGIVSALSIVTNNSAHRERASLSGLELASGYSWKNTAQMTLQAISKVA